MGYCLRFYNNQAQTFIYSGHIATLAEAVETAKKELANGTESVEVRRSVTNELMATVEIQTKTENHV